MPTTNQAGDQTAEPVAPVHSDALRWIKMDCVDEALLMAKLSPQGYWLHKVLEIEAWQRDDGSCSVALQTMRDHCALKDLDERRMYRELTRGAGWVLSVDECELHAPVLLARKTAAMALIVKRIRAGQASGRSRAKGAPQPKRPRNPKPAERAHRATPQPGAGAVEHVLNTCSAHAEHNAADVQIARDEARNDARNALPDNDLNTCSTHAEQIRRSCSSSSSVPELEEEEQLRTSGDVPVTTTAVRHAGGAAAVVTSDRVPTQATPQVVPDWRHRLCAERVAEVQPPPDWMTADVATLVSQLYAAGTGVDVERGLFRLLALAQRRTADGHLPVLAEIRALLAGADHRDGLLAIADAPTALALALHGAAAYDEPVAPLVVRAIAVASLRAVREEVGSAEPLRIAARVAYEFASRKRRATGYALPVDNVRAPERLHGYVTRAS